MQNLYTFGHKLELILARHLISDSNNSGKSINPCRMSLIWVHVSGLTVWGNSWRKKTLYAISKLGLRIFWFRTIFRSFFWLNQQTNYLLLYLFNINTLVFVTPILIIFNGANLRYSGRWLLEGSILFMDKTGRFTLVRHIELGSMDQKKAYDCDLKIFYLFYKLSNNRLFHSK